MECLNDMQDHLDPICTRSRKHCRTVVGQVTGFNQLALHANRMGISNDDIWRRCRELVMRETHIPLLSGIRTCLRYLGTSQFKGLGEVSKLVVLYDKYLVNEY